jgi:hypothetical protein
MNMRNSEGVWRLEYLELPTIENIDEKNDLKDSSEESE